MRCPYGSPSGRKNQEYQILLISQVRLNVCVHVCRHTHKIYAHVHITTIIKERETVSLKESRSLYKEEFRGRKGKEKDVITL